MATIVLAHGAWSAAWAWKKMRPLFRAAGHDFFSPTYTGLGERAHLARPEIDLSTHVQDVLAVLEIEDLTDVTLLGPESFYPYHYTEKHRRTEDHGANPATFGAHHWAGSWL